MEDSSEIVPYACPKPTAESLERPRATAPRQVPPLGRVRECDARDERFRNSDEA